MLTGRPDLTTSLTTLPQVDWSLPENQPVKPQLIGTKVYEDFPLEEVLDYIDWNPFFQVPLLFSMYPTDLQAAAELIPGPCLSCMRQGVISH